MNASEVHVAMCFIFKCVLMCCAGLKSWTCVSVVDMLMISCEAHYQAESTPCVPQSQLVHYVQCVSTLMLFIPVCPQWAMLDRTKKSSSPRYVVIPIIRNSFWSLRFRRYTMAIGRQGNDPQFQFTLVAGYAMFKLLLSWWWREWRSGFEVKEETKSNLGSGNQFLSPAASLSTNSVSIQPRRKNT